MEYMLKGSIMFAVDRFRLVICL